MFRPRLSRLRRFTCVKAAKIYACAATPASSRLRPFWAHGNVYFMRIIARRTLREFVERRRGHRDQPALLDAWFDEVKKARWSSAADIKRSYATASIVSAERIVFNMKGNDYRLVVAIDFEKAIVWIKWIGTHRDYDKIGVSGVDHEH
jgi:mRNA interferase HigB